MASLNHLLALDHGAENRGVFSLAAYLRNPNGTKHY